MAPKIQNPPFPFRHLRPNATVVAHSVRFCRAQEKFPTAVVERQQGNFYSLFHRLCYIFVQPVAIYVQSLAFTLCFRSMFTFSLCWMFFNLFFRKSMFKVAMVVHKLYCVDYMFYLLNVVQSLFLETQKFKIVIDVHKLLCLENMMSTWNVFNVHKNISYSSYYYWYLEDDNIGVHITVWKMICAVEIFSMQICIPSLLLENLCS